MNVFYAHNYIYAHIYVWMYICTIALPRDWDVLQLKRHNLKTILAQEPIDIWLVENKERKWEKEERIITTWNLET